MPKVRYEWVSVGHGDIIAAYSSVSAAAVRASRVATRAATDTAGKQRAAAEGASTARQKAEEKWGAQAARVAEQVAKREAATKEKALKHVAGIRDRHFRDQQRAEERAERHAATAARRRAAAERKANEAIARERTRTVGRIGTRVGGAIGGVATGLAVGATALVGAAARQNLALQERANRFAINARLAGGEVDPEQARKTFENVAISTPGIASADVAEAALGFQSKTGKAVGADMLGVFAEVASAAGADIKDVADAAASLSLKFDIASIDDMRAALAVLTQQGAKGSFELKDAASQFERLSAAASRFGLDKGVQGAAKLGGLTQIARGATGSSEQAATAVEATLRQLVSKSGDLKAFGVDVFTDETKTRTRDVQDILVETISKVGGKGGLPALQKIFGEEGIRAISPLISTFTETRAQSTGTEAERTAKAIAAMRRQIEEATSTTGAVAAMNEAATAAQRDSTARLTSSWEGLKRTVSDVIGPMDRLGEAVEGVLEAIHLIDAQEAFRAPKNVQDLKVINEEITKLETKGDKRTRADSRRLDMMVGLRDEFLRGIRGNDVPTPLIEAPKGPRKRGFAGSREAPHVGLTGMDAFAALMKEPIPGGPVPGPTPAAVDTPRPGAYVNSEKDAARFGAVLIAVAEKVAIAAERQATAANDAAKALEKIQARPSGAPMN